MSDYDGRDRHEDEFHDESQYDESPGEVDDEQYALAGQQAPQYSPRSSERGGNALMPAPMCTKCQRGRHPVSECEYGKQRTACLGWGHIESRCLHKCKTCMLVHPAGQCEYIKFVDAVKKWMRDDPRGEDVPKHLRDMIPLNGRAA